MEIDHIFIFTNKPNEAAKELTDSGFTEGSSRSHPGQGTANRKFYFENFFLELLYVTSEEEIKNEKTSSIYLWERSQYQQNNFSPYGLCVKSSAESDILFGNAVQYQPDYLFPNTAAIEMIPNELHPQLPLTFRRPSSGNEEPTTEPTVHANGTSKLTRAIFGVEQIPPANNFIIAFEEEPSILITEAGQNMLVLEFDHKQQEKSHRFKSLPLEIEY
jgi:hypothetical protein